jgi:GTPase
MTTVVIIGKPNVGKSTLFNKLANSQKAITHNCAGITRDYKIAKATLGDLEFNLIDTAGLHFSKKLSDLETKFNAQTELALTKANIVLFVLDGKDSIADEDRNIARLLRKHNLPVILVINKCDYKKTNQNFNEFFELGYKDICKISAEHTIGFSHIYEHISAYCSNKNEETVAPIKTKIKIAIIGRPNAGKSTFVNNLLNESRLITGPEPGITRDSISVHFDYKDFAIEFMDTAGLRKKRNIQKESIEKLSVEQTINSIDSTDITILIVDINNFLENQDLKIASVVTKRGKPLVLVVNKKDTIKDSQELDSIKDEIQYLAGTKLSNAKNLPIVYISALHKSNLTEVLRKCVTQYGLWNTRIPTAKLNEWIEHVMEHHQPPLSKTGKRIRIKYINQIKIQPPVFKIFTNKPTEIPVHYIKYLINKLAEDFELQGIPIKIIKSKSPNPYANNG